MSREGDFSRDAPTSSTSPGALRGPRGPPSCHFCLPAKSGGARHCVTWKWQPTALEKALLQNNPHPHHRDLPPPRPGPKPISPASDGELGGFGGPRVVSAGAELSEPPPGATQGSLPRNQRLLLLGGSCGLWAGGSAAGVPGDGRAWLGMMPTSSAVTFSSSVSRPGLMAQLYFGRHSSVFTGTPFKPGVLLGRATLQLCTGLPRGTHPPCCWGHKEWPCRGPWGARCPLGATGARCHQERHSPVFGDRGHPALTSPRRGQQDRGSATPLPCLGGHRGHQHRPHGATSGCPPPRWLTGVIVARRRWTSEPTRTMSRAWKLPWCLRLPLPPL